MFKQLKNFKYQAQAAARLQGFMEHYRRNCSSLLSPPFQDMPEAKLANLIVGKVFTKFTMIYGTKPRPHFTSLALDSAIGGLLLAATQEDDNGGVAYWTIAGWIMEDMEAKQSEYGLTELDQRVMLRCQKEAFDMMQEKHPEFMESANLNTG